jgi:hypothetical protein
MVSVNLPVLLCRSSLPALLMAEQEEVDEESTLLKVQIAAAGSVRVELRVRPLVTAV